MKRNIYLGRTLHTHMSTMLCPSVASFYSYDYEYTM